MRKHLRNCFILLTLITLVAPITMSTQVRASSAVNPDNEELTSDLNEAMRRRLQERLRNRERENNNDDQPNTPSQPSNPSTPSNPSSFIGQVVDLVNQERAKQGLSKLSYNNTLEKSAQGHASDMARNNYFSHTNQQGQRSSDRIKAAGYGNGCNCSRYYGENIARGQTTPEKVMSDWMNSSGHRRNILSANFKEIGVATAKASNGKIYWVQNFGGMNR